MKRQSTTFTRPAAPKSSRGLHSRAPRAVGRPNLRRRMPTEAPMVTLRSAEMSYLHVGHEQKDMVNATC